MIQLGQKVKDRVTGFTGVVTAITEHLNGCRRICVQPPVDKDGKHPDAYVIDEPQLAIVDKRSVLADKKPDRKAGGPTTRVPASRAPRR